MKQLIGLFLVFAAQTALAWNSDVTVKAGDNKFTAIPACGPDARVKAVYSKTSGNLVLRMCDNVKCEYPVMLNTNSKFEVSGDGKTEYYWSQASGKKLNDTCYEFELHNPTGTQRIRNKIGREDWLNNTATITVE